MAPNPDHSIAEAKILSLFLGCIFYGVYLVSTGMCAGVLLGGGKAKRKKIGFIVSAFALFVLATIDIVLNLHDILDAFIFEGSQHTPEEVFEDDFSWVYVWETTNLQVLALIGDGMLVYRCWIVLSRRLVVVVIPVALWLAGVALTGFVGYLTAKLHRANAIVIYSQLSHAIVASLAVTFALTLFTTGLIVWRIHTVNVEASTLLVLPRNRRSRFAHVMRIVIESGLLYTVFVLISLITEGMKSTAAYPVSQMMLSVIGIAYNLIIIRVDRGVAVDGGTYNDPTVVTGQAPSAMLQFNAAIASQTSEDVSVISSVQPKAVLRPAVLEKSLS